MRFLVTIPSLSLHQFTDSIGRHVIKIFTIGYRLQLKFQLFIFCLQFGQFCLERGQLLKVVIVDQLVITVNFAYIILINSRWLTTNHYEYSRRAAEYENEE